MGTNEFCGARRDDIIEYALNAYGTQPEYLWKKYPTYSVLRRVDNKKWYAAILDVPKNKLGIGGNENIYILDIKCDALVREIFLSKPGFLPAYHMNRDNWITVLLDGSVDKDTVFGLLDESFVLAGGKAKTVVRNQPTSWLVPANPKYYDVEKAFADSDTILWKQSNSVIVGDTVYLYVAAPLSCVRYKCKVLEADIPYEYADENVSMKKVMKIERLYTYDTTEFDMSALKKFGIVSVRGPRGIPARLLRKLEGSAD